MADRSAIEWTDATWTPIRAKWTGEADGKAVERVGWHCEHVSEGCRHCYAEGINRRLGTGLDFKPGNRKSIDLFLDEEMLLKPLRWKRPRMIFVCSMTDLFAGFVSDKWIDRIFAVAALCPQHILQVLTKRTERMRDYLADPETPRRIIDAALRMKELPHDWRWPLPNVWAGTSIEDQPTADERIPLLRDTPAVVRWVSVEPLLAPLTLAQWLAVLDWVVTGGESGAGARPIHPHWVRLLRDQCAAMEVPFLFKQWGQYVYEQLVDTSYDHAECVAVDGRRFAYTADLVSGTAMPRAVLWHDAASWEAVEAPPPGAMLLHNVGKKAAGRHIDGREHDEYPETSTEGV